MSLSKAQIDEIKAIVSAARDRHPNDAKVAAVEAAKAIIGKRDLSIAALEKFALEAITAERTQHSTAVERPENSPRTLRDFIKPMPGNDPKTPATGLRRFVKPYTPPGKK